MGGEFILKTFGLCYSYHGMGLLGGWVRRFNFTKDVSMPILFCRLLLIFQGERHPFRVRSLRI